MVKIAIFMLKVTIGTVKSTNILMIWTDASGQQLNALIHVRKTSIRGHEVAHGGHHKGQNGEKSLFHEKSSLLRGYIR